MKAPIRGETFVTRQDHADIGAYQVSACRNALPTWSLDAKRDLVLRTVHAGETKSSMLRQERPEGLQLSPQGCGHSVP